jgi:hypothetical protein
MVLRNGPKRRKHFAHYIENANCTPETVLHKASKEAIRLGIENALATRRNFPMKWECSICEQNHFGDLAATPRTVSVEREISGIRPDLLLVSPQGKPLVAIEVVVTHDLEEETIEKYQRINIPILRVRAAWERIPVWKDGLGEVDAINAPCRARHCRVCGGAMMKMSIGVSEGYSCYQCHRPMSVLDVVDDDTEYGVEPTAGMIDIAGRLGIRIRWKYSKTVGASYPMHICPYCGTKQGNWFVHFERGVDWISETVASQDRLLFFWCEQCDILEKRKEGEG